MEIDVNHIEFNARGTATLEEKDLMTGIPETVTDRLASEMGDIEIKEFNVSIKEGADEQTFEWYVHGRRDPLSL